MKRLYVRAVVLLLLILVFSGMKHPYYLSVTQLKLRGPEKKIEGSVKLFLSDLEKALRKLHNTKVDLLHVNDTAQLSIWIKDYFNKRLQLSDNQGSIPFSVLGFEQEDENFWVYLEYSLTCIPTKLTVENTLLYDFIDHQINLITFENGEKKITRKLTKPDKTVVFAVSN
jgi:hypothetical protein